MRLLLERWLFDEAAIFLAERLEFLCARSGCSAPPALQVKAYKARWGSCKLKRGQIQLNWRLIHGPVDDFGLRGGA